MTRARALAAFAAIATALLLQATVVGPVTLPVAVSLPAVLVATVALVDGPGTGLSIGFVAGLLADLGSNHPAGVLALCWMGLGLGCGVLSAHRSVRSDAAVAALACTVASVLTALLFAATRSASGPLSDAFVHAVPVALGDAVLALALTPLVRAMLRNDSLRPPVPIGARVGRPAAIPGRVEHG